MSERILHHLYLTMGGPTCHHVKKAQHSHLNMEGPACHHVKKDLHLNLAMGGPSYHHVRKALHLHLTIGGPSYCHVRKALHLHLTMRPNLPPCQKGSALTSEHGRPILPPCREVSWTHHFPLEGTSIWRTPSFSLKYSNFTLAISSIESHQG